jgi:diguanylate cyclase (GGDEF)-like protein/PAS domain S-box-containing protein
MADDQELVQQLRQLTEEFIAGLPVQMGAIETAWTRIWRNNGESHSLTPLIQQVHSVAGSAGSLGFERIARASNELLALLKNHENGENCSQNCLERGEVSMQALRRSIYTDQQVDLNELVQRLGAAKAVTVSLQEMRADRLIYMVDDDPIQAGDLAVQVGYFGYTVQIFTSLAGLEAAIRKTQPTALLMDVSFPEGRMAGYDTIAALREKFKQLPPVIFVSVNDAMPYRLQAVRVGGEAYFTKPVDVSELVDVLDRLIFHDIVTPYRVLVVEDSRLQANYITLQLKKAGIITETVTNPLEVIDHLISFNPDLLLLDMYMPDCTGMEMAQIIRQMEQFVSIPIVFLSAETDKDKQMAAMGIGGDDFLTKPIEPEHLIAAVTTRIERYRKLRALMIQDGLTGLLNHSTTKERLTQETERARRQNTSLAFAMLDLDFFKQVNDSYGHATGDRVLKSLAHMLRQRLRSSDTIGRFGGEEFAVIMPDTDEPGAVQIMRDLSENFAKIRHHIGEKEFSVSFSCGVAAFPDCDSSEALTRTSDMAMYAAKAAGRKRTMAASECSGDEFSLERARPAPVYHQTSGLSHAALYQKLVRHANSTILRFDPQGKITYANEFALRLFGYAPAELLGRPVIGALLSQTDAGAEDFKAMIADIVRHPDRYTHNESENTRKDGEKVWMTWSNTPLLDEKGDLVEVLSIGNDISDRKIAETDLKRTGAYLSAISHISQMVVNQQNLLDLMEAVSRKVAEVFQAQHVGIGLLNNSGDTLEFIGNSQDGWSTSPETPNQVSVKEDQAYRLVVQGARAIFVSDAQHNPLLESIHNLLKLHHVQGRTIIPLISRSKVIGTMNLDFEDDLRKPTKQELEMAETIAGSISGVIENSSLFSSEQRQRQFFEALVRNIPVAVVMIDLESHIQSWNPGAEALFGYTPAEVIGKAIDDLLTSPEMHEQAVGFTQAAMQGGELIHAFSQRLCKNGRQADVELLAVPVYVDGQPQGSMAIYHDIRELVRARREAEAANETKSAFLATMSHEIRTPLNAIVGMTTLLMDTELSQEQRDFSETIRSSSDALLTIINDILDFSKIEAGRMELEEAPFDLRACIESAFDLVNPRANEKGIDLAYLLDPNVPPFIISDSTRLRQILLNLLSNALKFTPEGEVVLSVSLKQNDAQEGEGFQLHFAVRDTGIGIPPERMDRLFRSFSQVDASTTRKYGGTGLGLAISKRLSELMGGQMWVESAGVPDQGSTFHFTIQARLSTSPVPVFLHVKQPELSGRRALIVDDNATNRYILMRQLQSWGMISEETADPLEALAWIRAGQSYDVGLLDMQMPEMDGLSLAKEIQHGTPEQAGLPLIMLTSLGNREVNNREVTFAAFLTKPIKPALLYTTLLSVFGAHTGEVSRVKEKTAFETDAAPLHPLRILLAEDTMVNQKVALLLLERIGCRADVAGNGLEVLAALQRQAYDVILMDVQMPEMDGLEATKQVRAGAWMDGRDHGDFTSQPYIIAMTANAMQGDREACLAAGMDDYVSKPVRIDELAQALQRAAKAHKPAASPPKDEGQNQAVEIAIDENTFQKFGLSLGDDPAALLAEMIEDYLAEGAQQVGEIHSAGEKGDAERVCRAAHSLKSSSQMFGALPLAQSCKELELVARSGRLEGLAEHADKIEREFSAVKTALLGRINNT